MTSRAEKLAESRRRTHNLQVAQLRPGQFPEKLELLRNLERSQRAATQLHRKALEHEQGEATVVREDKVPASLILRGKAGGAEEE